MPCVENSNPKYVQLDPEQAYEFESIKGAWRSLRIDGALRALFSCLFRVLSFDAPFCRPTTISAADLRKNKYHRPLKVPRHHVLKALVGVGVCLDGVNPHDEAPNRCMALHKTDFPSQTRPTHARSKTNLSTSSTPALMTSWS
jgi:hypothetical protein